MECLTQQATKSTSVPTTTPAPVAATAPATAPPTTAAPVVQQQTAVPVSNAKTPLASGAPAPATNPPPPVQASCNPNVVTIPVPIVSPEDIYTYVSVKGSLHDRTCALFGLNDAEVLALSKRFENGSTQIVNGVMINAPPMQIINTLSQLGYKVVCSTGEAEIVWTMQREV